MNNSSTLHPVQQNGGETAQGRHAGMVERIRRGHPEGLEELYGLANNFTFFLMRQLGRDDVQDKVHDVFVTTAQAITGGKLRDPERVIPFVTTVTRFYTYSQIERRTRRRKVEGTLEHVNVPDARVNLEQSAYQKQQIEITRQILSDMNARDREVLLRFYLKEQSKEQICREMRLTATQFRLLKSKAKSIFTRLGLLRLCSGTTGAKSDSKSGERATGSIRTIRPRGRRAAVPRPDDRELPLCG